MDEVIYLYGVVDWCKCMQPSNTKARLTRVLLMRWAAFVHNKSVYNLFFAACFIIDVEKRTSLQHDVVPE